MHIARAARSTLIRLGAVALASTLLAACGSGSTGGQQSDGKVTLSIDLFGTFGFEEAGLYKEYEKLHPNITIKQTDTEQEQNYWKSLQTRLAGGGGLADVQGVEIGRITSVAQLQSDKFEDLNQYGAGKLKKNFTAAKWGAATTKDGAVIGLGTDNGPGAMCYRTDLLKKAGLPTDREVLAQRWSTWQGYLDLGKQYKKSAPGKSAWIDSVRSIYTNVAGQSEERYYDTSGKLIWETSPTVKEAWDLSVEAAEAGLSGSLDQWSPSWNQAFAAGSFATLPCPAWMLGYIKGQAGKAGEGKWDVAKMPGRAGNWGDSYLAIPQMSQHKKEAYDLVQWLTAPEQQAKLFQRIGNFPSSVPAIEKVADTKDPYFSGAPIGEIFGSAAEQAPVQILGVNDQDVQEQIAKALFEVERKGTSSSTAWNNVKKGVQNALG